MNVSVEEEKGTEKVIKYCWAIKDPEATLTDLDTLHSKCCICKQMGT
jgi:hypothetical protein